MGEERGSGDPIFVPTVRRDGGRATLDAYGHLVASYVQSPEFAGQLGLSLRCPPLASRGSDRENRRYSTCCVDAR